MKEILYIWFPVKLTFVFSTRSTGTPKSNCNVQTNTTVLAHDDCVSTTPVEITSCSGTCGTSSMWVWKVIIQPEFLPQKNALVINCPTSVYYRYSSESNSVMHTCSCCVEEETSEKEVEMICRDGSKTTFTYIYIDSCGCQKSECTEDDRRRRRRWILNHSWTGTLHKNLYQWHNDSFKILNFLSLRSVSPALLITACKTLLKEGKSILNIYIIVRTC